MAMHAEKNSDSQVLGDLGQKEVCSVCGRLGLMPKWRCIV